MYYLSYHLEDELACARYLLISSFVHGRPLIARGLKLGHWAELNEFVAIEHLQLGKYGS